MKGPIHFSNTIFCCDFEQICCQAHDFVSFELLQMTAVTPVLTLFNIWNCLVNLLIFFTILWNEQCVAMKRGDRRWVVGLFLSLSHSLSLYSKFRLIEGYKVHLLISIQIHMHSIDNRQHIIFNKLNHLEVINVNGQI